MYMCICIYIYFPPPNFQSQYKPTSTNTYINSRESNTWWNTYSNLLTVNNYLLTVLIYEVPLDVSYKQDIL